MANVVKDLVIGDTKRLEYLHDLEENIILQSISHQKRKEMLETREEQLRAEEEMFSKVKNSFASNLMQTTPDVTEYVDKLKRDHELIMHKLDEQLSADIDRMHRNYAAKLGKLSSDHHDRLFQLEKEQNEIIANYHVEQEELIEQLNESEVILEQNKETLAKVQDEHRQVVETYKFIAHEIARATAHKSDVQNEIESLRTKRDELTKYAIGELDKLNLKTLMIRIGTTDFEVSTDLLSKRPTTLLGMIVTDTVFKKNKQLKSGAFFFDEDAEMFPYVLEAMRSNEVNFPYPVDDHLHMRRLSNSLKYFRVQPDVINFIDNCLHDDYEFTKHALKYSNKNELEGKLHRLFVQSTFDSLLTTPNEYNDIMATVTGARSIIVTATLAARVFVKEVDPRKFSGYTMHLPLNGKINSIVVHDNNLFTTHINVTDNFSKFFTYGDRKTLSDQDCSLIDFPNGVVVTSVTVCLPSTDVYINWTMRFQMKSTTVNLNDNDYRWYLASKALSDEIEQDEPLSF